MAKKKQRKFSKEFKFNVVLESFITGNAAATASRHSVHISQLSNWRKVLKAEGPDLYEYRRSRKTDEQRKIEELEKIIGKVTIENHVLKKTHEMLN